MPFQLSSDDEEVEREEISLKALSSTYRDMKENVKRAAEKSGSDLVAAVKALHTELKKSDDLLTSPDSLGLEQAPFDANFMASSAVTSKQLVLSLQTDCRKFDINEFIEKLITMLGGRERGDERIDDKSFITLGKNEGQKIIRTAPIFNFMYGSFDPGEVYKKAPEKRKRRDLSHLNSKVEPRIETSKNMSQKEDKTPIEVKRLFKEINTKCKSNNGRPIKYFQHVVNKSSFANTVERIFQSSFLVKESKLELNKIGDDIVISPPSNEKEQETPSTQSILSFSIEDWKKWSG